MRRFLPFVASFFLALSGLWAQGTGDMSFIAWNADGNDGFAMVTFVDLQPNTVILFRDEEWAGSAFVGTGEGQAEWNTGAALIPAGTVILFDEMSTATPTVSYGTLSNTDIGISSTSEGIFCFFGTDTQTPTTFICAMGNADVATAFGTLDGTGLLQGTSAITLQSGIDMAEYTGPRSGLDVNGYRLALNLPANYITQDGSGDQHNDGIEPDVPFDITPFTFATGDVTPPSAVGVTVLSATQVEVVFSEPVTNATLAANYAFVPALTISNVEYNGTTNTALITHSGFSVAVPYALTVSGMLDAAGNLQVVPNVFPDLLINDLLPNLRITEIMYNPPAGVDSLEFIEIWNFEPTAVELGGFVVQDAGNFNFALPSITLQANSALLLASDAAGAQAFFGVEFLDIPGSGNLLGNGGEALRLSNSLGATIDAVTYDDASPWPLAADGTGPSIELINASLDQNLGTSWIAATTLRGQVEGIDVLASPGEYLSIMEATVSFADDHIFYDENAGQISLPIDIIGNAGLGSFAVEVEAGSALQGADFSIESTAVQLSTLQNGDLQYSLNITTINNDAALENDEWFSLRLTGSNVLLGSNDRFVVYIKDNDTPEAPIATEEIDLSHVGSYHVEQDGSAEIVAHDPASQRLFVVNSIFNKLHILDFSNPSNIVEVSAIDMSIYGDGINSVAVRDGLVALAVERDGMDGAVVFLDINGTLLREIPAGNLPDHVSFTPNGNYVLTANEGEPNSDYTFDPEGSVTIIDLRNGLNAATAVNANFNVYDGDLDLLRSLGIRIFGPGATVSQDMEPEYITYNSSGTVAFVTCQENNAVARVNIAEGVIDGLLPLGYKDHLLQENAIDASDRTDDIALCNWPVLGMYNPDGIASFEVNGTTYLVTANEGDAREYETFAEETAIEDLVLDPTAFPDAEILLERILLGRLNVTAANGDTDGDGDYDELYVFGARSFTIWNGDEGTFVWDSGAELERITAADPVFGELFNASNSNNTFKNRSDNKGPEPESVITATINGSTYAFVALERTGGIVTYDVSDPSAPVFVDYINTRTLGDDEGGDLGPEGLLYINPDNSPLDTGIVVVANEISATLSIFTIPTDFMVGNEDIVNTDSALEVYPNPVANTGVLYFNRPTDFRMYDAQGREVLSGQNAPFATLNQLPAGNYVLNSANGEVVKIIVTQ